MRRFSKGVLVGFVIASIVLGSSGYAQSVARQITVSFMPLRYIFDGVERTAPADKPGFIFQGTTYVPLRFMGEALGKEVLFDAQTSTITVSNTNKPIESTPAPKEEAPQRITSELFVAELANKGRYQAGLSQVLLKEGVLYADLVTLSILAGLESGSFITNEGHNLHPALAGELGFTQDAPRFESRIYYEDPSRLNSDSYTIFSLTFRGRTLEIDSRQSENFRDGRTWLDLKKSMAQLGISLRYHFDEESRVFTVYVP